MAAMGGRNKETRDAKWSRMELRAETCKVTKDIGVRNAENTPAV
jgi:hypothetical protein